EVHRLGDHLEFAVLHRPLLAGAIPVDLDAVAIGIAQVDRLAHAVVGGARQTPTAAIDALNRLGQVPPLGHSDGEVVQAGSAAIDRLCADLLHQPDNTEVAAPAFIQADDIAIKDPRPSAICDGQFDRID